MCAGGQRKRRAAPRRRPQAAVARAEEEEDVEAGFNPENPYQVSHADRLARFPLYVLCEFAAVCSDLGGYLRRPSRPESFSQLCERQQMPGSRRRAPDCHCESQCMLAAVCSVCMCFLCEAVQSFPFSIEAV